MIQDYRGNTYANAVNVSAPYYNYYQYLSFHTTAPFTAEKYDAYIENLCDEAEVDWGIYDEYENKTTSTQIYNFDGILN